MFTAALVFTTALSAGALATPPGHGFHPPMPGQTFYLQWKFADDPHSDWHDVAIDLADTSIPARLDQKVSISSKGDGAAITMTQFIPNASFDQQVVPIEEGGTPGLLLAIVGAKQSYRRWLMADDPARNRLTSLIGTWRYMSVPDVDQRDVLFDQFKHEFERAPMLEIAPPSGEPGRIEAAPGKKLTFDGGLSVEVLRFHPHFGYDEKTKEPKNLSDARINPGVLVRLKKGEKAEERWVFSKFPGFSQAGDGGVACGLRLDCPAERERPSPDYVLVTIARKNTESWLRYEGKVEVAKLELGEANPIPSSRYTFSMEQFVPAGKLVESYKAAPGSGSVTALQVRFPGASGSDEEAWLEIGKARVLETPAGPIAISFGPQAGSKGMGGHP